MAIGVPRRVLALAAAVAALVAIPLSFVLGAAYLATEEAEGEEPLVGWDGPFRSALPGLYEDPEATYLGATAVFPFILAAGLGALWLIRDAQRGGETKVARVAFWVLFAAQAFYALGVATFAFVSQSDAVFIGMMIPGMLLAILGHIVYGFISLRARRLPRDVPWLMIAAGVLVIPLSAVLGHNSIGLLGWFVLWLRVALPAVGLQPQTAPSAGVDEP